MLNKILAIGVMVSKIILCKEEPLFISPEGEGPWTGRLCAWMRVSFCNLRCAWITKSDGKTGDEITLCDTPYTSHHPSRLPMEYEDVKKFLLNAKTSYVSISGGEPFMNPTLMDLVNDLQQFKEVKIETNGTIFRECNASLICISPKLSSSSAMGMVHESKRYNLESFQSFADFYKDRIAWKFVVNSPEDILEIERDFTEPLRLNSKDIWLMPMGREAHQLNERAPWIIEECKLRGWNFSHRLHIMIYGNKVGV